MKFHPVADLFPRMSAEDFAALREDIRAHGVLDPIWVWKGQVIDGRHRALACDEVGIKCPTREWEGIESDLVSFVLSLNLKRRHLDASQRAMVAAAIANLAEGRPKTPPIGGVSVSTEQAATMLNVGVRSVERAKKVVESGAPELKEAVEQGKVSVAAAAEVAELPKSQQKRVVAQDRVQEVAAELREERKPKADPAPKDEKPDELEALKSENEDLRGRLAEMASAQEPLQDEVEFLRKIESEGDKLAAACAEVKRLQIVVRGQEGRIRGLMNEKKEAVSAAKMWKAKFEKANKR